MADFELSTGSAFGPYALIFPLGRGGMGEVWAAHPRQPPVDPERLLALKVMRRSDLGSNHAAMFRDEARVARALEHPSVVRTRDSGLAEGRLFMAMELVRGPSLTTLLQRLVVDGGRIPPEGVARIGGAVAEALYYAHVQAQVDGRALGLIHRDISPHNILLGLDGQILLTDFGVARTRVQEHLSRVGTVRGKPSYMAPEQVRGQALDHRTDLFSLGIVLHECASLRRLFGRSEPSRSLQAVLEYEPPSLRGLPGFPPALAQVIGACLAKDPEARPAHARVLARALGRAAADLPPFGAPELQALIRRHFDPEEFDLQSRMTPGVAAAVERGILPRPDAAATAVLPVPLEAPRAWPATSVAEPLAPEALEEARTRLARRARSIPPAPMPPPTRASGSQLAVRLSSPRKRHAFVFALTAAMGIAAIGTWGLLDPAPRIDPLDPEPSGAPPRKPAVEVRPRPTPTVRAAAAGAGGSSVSRGAPSEADAPSERPAKPTAAPSRPPGPRRSLRGPDRARAEKGLGAPRGETPPTPTATPEAVYRALKRLAEADPGRAEALMVDFTEYLASGGSEPGVLAEHLNRVRRALGQAPSPAGRRDEPPRRSKPTR